MAPYVYLILLTSILAAGAQFFRHRDYFIYLITSTLLLITLVLFAGLRDVTVGTDTGNYLMIFENKNSLEDFFENANYEYAFFYLNYIVKSFTDNFNVLLICIASISLLGFHYGISKISQNIFLSYFIFLSFGFYTFFFNGARQGLACSIVFVSFLYLIDRNFIKYSLSILLAALFHKTAILMLPLYLLFNLNNAYKNKKWLIVFALIAVVSISIVIDFMAKIDARYSYYANSENSGGHLIVSFFTLLGLVFYILKNKIKHNRQQYDLFLLIYMFGVTISLVSSFLRLDPSGILRFNQYFLSASIILVPIIFINTRNNVTRLLIMMLLILPSFIFYYMYHQRIANLAPYISVF